MGYVKSIVLGDYVEIYEYQKELPDKQFRKKRVKRLKSFRILRYDNMFAREKRFRRLVVANCSRKNKFALLTLTMLRTVSITQSYECLRRFFRRLYQSQGKDNIRYIGIPEFQKRGAIHFHILVWGLPDYVIKQERDLRNLQRLWQVGFVDCRQAYGDFKVANYLSKYMSKAMSDQRILGRRSYCTSSNILRPVLVTSMSPISYSKEIFGLDLRQEQPISEKHFISKWLGCGCYKLYDLKKDLNDD